MGQCFLLFDKLPDYQKMKIHSKAVLVAIVGTIVLFLALFFLQDSFLKEVPSDQEALFKMSSFYFMIACVVCIVLLEMLSVFALDKLAMGFLVLMMIKLGGYMMIYTSGTELPKWIRLMLLAPLFLGILIEVSYLYYRIIETEKEQSL